MNASAVSRDGTSLHLLRRGEEATVDIGATIFLLPGLYPLRLQANEPASTQELQQQLKVSSTTATTTDTHGSLAANDRLAKTSRSMHKPKLASPDSVKAEASKSAATAVDADWDAAQEAWAAIEREVDAVPDSAVLAAESDAQQNKPAQQHEWPGQAAAGVHGSKRARVSRRDEEENDLSAESSVSDSDSDFDTDDYHDANSPGCRAVNKRKRRSTRSATSGGGTRNRTRTTSSTTATPAAALAVNEVSDNSNGGGSDAGGKAVWEWDAGRRKGWQSYSLLYSDKIEAAYQSWWETSLDDETNAEAQSVNIGNGYVVVFGGGIRDGMRQVKADDPTRSRKVRRRVG